MLTRSPGPAVPKLLLALPAVLALLALVLLPTVARAESSGEVVYHEGVAGLESIGPGQLGNSEGKSKAGHRAKAHGHTQPTNGEEGTGETASEPEAEPEGSHGGQVTPVGNGGKHPPGVEGQPPKTSAGVGSKPQASVSSTGEAPAPKRVETGGNGGGGSSPIVPILIAVAVLAALSIGVVLYRERMRDRGPSAPA